MRSLSNAYIEGISSFSDHTMLITGLQDLSEKGKAEKLDKGSMTNLCDAYYNIA